MKRWLAALALTLSTACAAPARMPPASSSPRVAAPVSQTESLPSSAGLAVLAEPHAKTTAPRHFAPPLPASASRAQHLANERLARLTTTASALDHPFAADHFRAEIEALVSRADAAVAAIRLQGAWRKRFVEAWSELDRLEEAVTQGARHEGLMMTQQRSGATSSDLERSAP